MTELQSPLEKRQALFGFDPEFLAKHDEPAINPELAIVDPHHHLWDHGSRYLFDEYLADISTGHKVQASVFVQCDAMYRADVDPSVAPVGETEFVNGIAAMSASGSYGPTRVCAGIVGYADLQLGHRVVAVLERHIQAGGGRFRGVRGRSVWDADRSIKGSSKEFPPGLLLDAKFREGVSWLAKYDLSFDSWLFHPQICELSDLAAKFSETTFILDHVGGPLGVGAYAGKRDEVFALWRNNLAELAQRPNVFVKLGGLAMQIFGFDLDGAAREKPASSEVLARLWCPYVLTCIDLFGTSRCMFESNFPVDKRGASYRVLWNAFKRIVADASEPERTALFKDTACRAYRLTV